MAREDCILDSRSGRQMKTTMKKTLFLTAALLSLEVASTSRLQAETNNWSFDCTLYGVLAGMDGDVTGHVVNADLDTLHF